MPKYTTNTQGDAEKVLSVMEPGCQYSVSTLSAACKIPISRMQPALAKLTEARRIVCHVTALRNRYALPDDSSAQPAAELSHPMGTHLTGYDLQVRQFMALCMLARPPVTANSSHEPSPVKARTRTRSQ